MHDNGKSKPRLPNKPRCYVALSLNHLISERWKSSSWSHEFENLREDMWAGVVDTDTRVR